MAAVVHSHVAVSGERAKREGRWTTSEASAVKEGMEAEAERSLRADAMAERDVELNGEQGIWAERRPTEREPALSTHRLARETTHLTNISDPLHTQSIAPSDWLPQKSVDILAGITSREPPPQSRGRVPPRLARPSRNAKHASACSVPHILGHSGHHTEQS